MAVLAGAGAVLLGTGLHQAILNPFVTYLVAMGFVLVALKLVRPRAVLAVVVLLALAFPVIGEIRNESRARVAGYASAERYSLSARIREDLYLADASGFPAGSADAGFGSLDAVRYGLVPSALDRGRADVTAGGTISLLLGRPVTTSSTVTTVGSLWMFVGSAGIMGYFAGMALLLFLLSRRLTAFRLTVVTLAVVGPLLIETVYPSNLASFFQACVAALLVAALMRLRRRTAVSAGGRPGPRSG